MRWFVALVGTFVVACSGSAETIDGVTGAEAAPPSGAADDGGASAPDGPPAQVCSYAPVGSVPFVSTTAADGTVVKTYAPVSPVGAVIALHGTGGSARSVADKVEWASFCEAAKARNYALVIPESKDRTKKQWDTTPSAKNADAIRIEAVIDELAASGAIATTTPLYFVGMSQGGGAAPIFATLLKAAGRPVRAVGVYCSGKSTAYRDDRYTLPTTFSLMAHDMIMTATAEVAANVAALKARGIDAEVTVKAAEPVCAKRFMRVPGISEQASAEIHAALVMAGTLDAQGHVVNAGGDADTSTTKAVNGLPAAHASYEKAVREQLDVAAAVHAFFGDHNERTLAFFDAHR